jgi:hypothetical protein
MSSGWESKMVESQQDSREAEKENARALPHDGTGADKAAAAAAIKGNLAADAEQLRRRQALELQRERVLSERTSSPHRRSALATALIEIEEKLSELGWTVHL